MNQSVLYQTIPDIKRFSILQKRHKFEFLYVRPHFEFKIHRDFFIKNVQVSYIM